jgi:succinate dehydrogenase / fumarate reductase cytochrome b subunit
MKKRPISPHLTVYKPMITSMSSILGRMAGAYTYLLGVVIFIFVAFSIQNQKYAGSTVISLLDFASNGVLHSSILAILTFISLFAFFLYILAVIRHIIWDFGFLLNLCVSKIMGYAMLLSSFVISLFLTIYMFLF